MSEVTDYILTHSVSEQESAPGIYVQVEALNSLLGAKGRFERVDQRAGGRKVFQSQVYLFAGNFLLPYEITDYFKALSWVCPKHVQLMFKTEHQDMFRIGCPYDDFWHCDDG